jgi:hypothetical protein
MDLETALPAAALVAGLGGLPVLLKRLTDEHYAGCKHTWVICRSCGKVINRWRNSGYRRWVGQRKAWKKKAAST